MLGSSKCKADQRVFSTEVYSRRNRVLFGRKPVLRILITSLESGNEISTSHRHFDAKLLEEETLSILPVQR